MRKRFRFAALSLTVLSSISALAGSSNSEKAIHAMKKAMESPALEVRIQKLKESNYFPGPIETSLLRETCGFAGCQSTYFVTANFSTVGVNRQGTAIAAIITAETYRGEGTVKKILTRREIRQLLID